MQLVGILTITKFLLIKTAIFASLEHNATMPLRKWRLVFLFQIAAIVFACHYVYLHAKMLKITPKSIDNPTFGAPPLHRQQQAPTLSSASRSTTTPYRKWAYAFLMAGVDPEYPSYKGIFYNVLVSAEIILHQTKSQADVVLMVQMSMGVNATKLTDEEESTLIRMGVKLIYIDLPDHHQNFYSIQYKKNSQLGFGGI